MFLVHFFSKQKSDLKQAAKKGKLNPADAKLKGMGALCESGESL